MRLTYILFAVTLAMLVPAVQAQDVPRHRGRRHFGPGWTGKIDPSEEKAGHTLNDAKLSGSPAAMQVTTGPAVTYWNPANKARATIP